jgi:hypothetical protein
MGWEKTIWLGDMLAMILSPRGRDLLTINAKIIHERLKGISCFAPLTLWGRGLGGGGQSPFCFQHSQQVADPAAPTPY